MKASAKYVYRTRTDVPGRQMMATSIVLDVFVFSRPNLNDQAGYLVFNEVPQQ